MNEMMTLQNSSDFRQQIKNEFNRFLQRQDKRFNADDCLRIDLHCHDHNSDVPDELWGRILGLPETWIKTKKLLSSLKDNGCTAFTVTNHNNARSCWKQLEKGNDILVGAEFTCFFPEYELFVHVLAYGFTPAQEERFNEVRGNIYDFVQYAHEQNVPLVLPHPLYFYTRNDKIDLALFEKFAVLFQRFEVLNGQRDQWQSVLTLNWLQSLTPDKIHQYAEKHNLNPDNYGVDPNKPKSMTGGSDCHMGIFAGTSGTLVHIPNLQQRLKTEKASDLALEAIRKGETAPYGYVVENQKLTIALLDYFSQVALNMEDPGLLRILLHRGSVYDKGMCFALSNFLLEMQKHKKTIKFFKFVHQALQGKKPNKLIKWNVNKDYRFAIEGLEMIADSKRLDSPQKFVQTVHEVIPQLVRKLSLLMINRIKQSDFITPDSSLSSLSSLDISNEIVIPVQLTQLFAKKNKSVGQFNIGEAIKSLSFPTMVNLMLLGTTMGSARLLYQNRNFLNEFADKLGKNQHPKRTLYLTDTLRDKNGVSNSLSGKLKAIQQNDYPIDFLICDANVEAEPHLHVIQPLTTFWAKKEIGEQEFRIPDLMEVAKIFYDGGYDRVVCSTEGPMAAVALYLKHMFNVQTQFFMHTDWLDFLRENTELNAHQISQVRRTLRFFYQQFDGVFVLNEDHKAWLTGHEMELDKDSVFLTAHHAAVKNPDILPLQKSDLFADADENTPVLFFSSRISKEKGVHELAFIFDRIKEDFPNVKFVIAGTGPEEKKLQASMPDAKFLGWIDKPAMYQMCASLDMMVFPSRFDTFGNVILEAFTYGMPVISYNCKGPKSIIQHDQNGYLVETKEQMAEQIVQHLKNTHKQEAFRVNAYNRSLDYQAEPIMTQFQKDMGLIEETPFVVSESVA